ncbi:MAG TPA: LCP family protein [Chondromyces sp.]|nr:LCP family protein [Chondromyces sp.]
MERIRPNRKRILKKFFAFFVLLLFTMTAFSLYQYRQGLSESDGDFEKDGQFTFNGEEEVDQINILLLGIDSRGEEHSRTDTIMIAHYDTKTHQPKVVSIMRDSYVNIPGHGKQKINAAYSWGGPELLRKTIKENFDIDVNYYAIMDFKGFSTVVDTIVPNGIGVNIPYEMSHGIGMTLHPGNQILHGDELLGYVRFRHDRESDFGRVRRQQEIISKLIDNAITMNNLVKLPKIWGIMDSYIETNVRIGTLLTIGKDIITEQSKDMETLRIPLNGEFENRRYEGAGAVLDLNLETNKQALQEFLSN